MDPLGIVLFLVFIVAPIGVFIGFLVWIMKRSDPNTEKRGTTEQDFYVSLLKEWQREKSSGRTKLSFVEWLDMRLNNT